jgi:hypothetical protein
MQPAVITFRPDNFLTVGLIVLIVYTAAVLAVQGLNRAGLLKLTGAPGVGVIPSGGVVNA